MKKTISNMEKKENTGTKLSVLLCNLVDYVRGDDRPLVFAVMQEIIEYFEQELDKAREEGKEEQAELDRSIYGMSFEEFNKEYKPVEDLSLSPKEK